MGSIYFSSRYVCYETFLIFICKFCGCSFNGLLDSWFYCSSDDKKSKQKLIPKISGFDLRFWDSSLHLYFVRLFCHFKPRPNYWKAISYRGLFLERPMGSICNSTSIYNPSYISLSIVLDSFKVIQTINIE